MICAEIFAQGGFAAVSDNLPEVRVGLSVSTALPSDFNGFGDSQSILKLEA
jgi:hypothetical protein